MNIYQVFARAEMGGEAITRSMRIDGDGNMTFDEKVPGALYMAFRLQDARLFVDASMTALQGELAGYRFQPDTRQFVASSEIVVYARHYIGDTDPTIRVAVYVVATEYDQPVWRLEFYDPERMVWTDPPRIPNSVWEHDRLWIVRTREIAVEMCDHAALITCDTIPDCVKVVEQDTDEICQVAMYWRSHLVGKIRGRRVTSIEDDEGVS